jgi:predicted transcriptional regulator
MSAASLSRSDQRRLERLAREAGTTPARILKTVLRDGFEYTVWFVRRVNEGDADLKAGRVMSTQELLSAIEKQRASRGRKSAATPAEENSNLKRSIVFRNSTGARILVRPSLRNCNKCLASPVKRKSGTIARSFG